MRKGPTLKVALIDWKFPHTETHRNMNVCNALLGTLLLAVTSFVPAYSEIIQQSDTGAQAQGPPPSGTQTATLPAQNQAAQSSAPLRVMVGKSLLINTTERLRRISLTDPRDCLGPSDHTNSNSGSRKVPGRNFSADLG